MSQRLTEIFSKIPAEVLPRHVAIIMDGNGRWAKQKARPRVFGHREGARRAREIIRVAGTIGIEALTLYAFSEENWGRPKAEVAVLMRLLSQHLANHRDELHKNNIRLRVIGDIESLPDGVRKLVLESVEMMRDNTGLALNVALSYGGRAEIARAAKAIAEQAVSGCLKTEDINSRLLDDYMYTAGLPELDLVIRTSGEMRVSNFLLWQMAYAELYFTPTFWPDFTPELFAEALFSFMRRRRRFGLTDEQLPPDVISAGDALTSQGQH